MSLGADAIAGLLVKVLLLIAGVLLGILLPVLLWFGVIMLVTGQWTTVLLLFGPPIVVPGGLAVMALHLLSRKHSVAACLVAALSAGSELLVFLVAIQIR